MATRVIYENGEEVERIQVGGSESYITHIRGEPVDWGDPKHKSKAVVDFNPPTHGKKRTLKLRGTRDEDEHYRDIGRATMPRQKRTGAHGRQEELFAKDALEPNPNCTLCKLHSTAKTVCLLGNGPINVEIMIVGEAPGAREDETGEPFVGRSGQLLNEVLEEFGFDRDQIFVTNAVSCRPPDNRTPTKAEINKCRTWLDHQIERVKPQYVLLLGNTPLQSITGAAGITKQRGRPFEKDGILYIPTYHPSFVLRDESNRLFLENDIKLLRDIVERGEIPREDKLVHTIVKTRKDFDKLLDALEGEVSFDIETNGLYPWQTYTSKFVKGVEVKEPHTARITMIGFGTEAGEFSIPMDMPQSPWSAEALDDMLEEIGERLEDCDVIAHNGKFDFLWMLVIYGVDWYRFFEFDTMLAHYALDENDRHGLKYLAQKYCGAPDWDVDRSTKLGEGSLDRLAYYHAHDLYYTRQLKFVFQKMLEQDDDILRVFERILMECARLFVEVEFDGVYIDVDKFDEAESYLREVYDTALDNLQRWEPNLGKDKRGNAIEFNWGSTQQLAKLLFGDPDDGGYAESLFLEPLDKTEAGNPSCSESVLKRIDHKMVGDLLKFREAKQQLSFFIDGWKPFLHKKRVKGKWHYFLHPSFKIHGTVTGRLSCEHPNLQQVPRDPRIRTLITAEPGWTLLECDLSQIELRIAAELANEHNLLQAFITDKDPHWLTAIREIERGSALKDLVLDTARTWKQDKSIKYSEAIEVLLEMGADAAVEINKAWKENRKKAKAINFGYLYGMWWKKFKLYARDNYGVDVTDEEAADSRLAFFELYPAFPAWHERQRRFARRNGYVKSLSGRKRRLPKATLSEDTPERGAAQRQAINSPVQSFGNELNLMAAIQLRKEYGRDVVKICGTVHDAILTRVRDDKVVEVTKRLLEIMSHPEMLDEFDIELTVPIQADATIGPWGGGVSLKKYIEAQKVKA